MLFERGDTLAGLYVPKDLWRLSLSRQIFPRNSVISVFIRAGFPRSILVFDTFILSDVQHQLALVSPVGVKVNQIYKKDTDITIISTGMNPAVCRFIFQLLTVTVAAVNVTSGGRCTSFPPAVLSYQPGQSSQNPWLHRRLSVLIALLLSNVLICPRMHFTWSPICSDPVDT